MLSCCLCSLQGPRQQKHSRYPEYPEPGIQDRQQRLDRAEGNLTHTHTQTHKPPYTHTVTHPSTHILITKTRMWSFIICVFIIGVLHLSLSPVTRGKGWRTRFGWSARKGSTNPSPSRLICPGKTSHTHLCSPHT